MTGRARIRAWIVMAAVVITGVGLAADTLYMRNGDQLRGELIGVRNGTVEFREERGSASRTLRIDLSEVRRIDFGNSRDEASGGDQYGGDRSGGPQNRPSGMRERTVVVSADVPFVDTGITLRSGQTVYFRAQGQVRWGPDRRDGAAGENNSPFNPNRPLPNRPAAALIGKVGDESGDLFFIGDNQGSIRVRGSGRLWLGINDDVLDDNSGNFRVTVYY